MPLNWQSFVATAPRGMPASFLAAIVRQPVQAVNAQRRAGSMGAPTKDAMASFVELFARWHGRPPLSEDWPTPLPAGAHGGRSYRWLPPEDELLASLAGRMERGDIAAALTARLVKLTGNPKAERNAVSVQLRLNKLGLWSTDVVGGITIKQAVKEVGSDTIVRGAIRSGALQARRLGRLLVIPHAAWEAWKASRSIAPPGYVPLASIRVALGISSDSKLPEFAAAGYVPTAIRCNPARPGVHSGQFGTWYIDPKVARKLVADRRAGRPMPWHGQPLLCNLKHTHARWVARRHPSSCETCARIWGTAGAPSTFEAFCQQYHPLAHGAKRHLTRVWTPGLTTADVASQAKRPQADILAAIKSGALRATKRGCTYAITRTDATRWIARRCPLGNGDASWIGLRTATSSYGFKRKELQAFIDAGKLETRGSAKTLQVMRQQVADLRRATGYTVKQAAAKLGVSVTAMKTLLAGVHWRQDGLVPMDTVQAAYKRLHTRQGFTLAEAAKEVRRPQAWIRARIQDGTIRVSRDDWDQRRLYVTKPMLARLRTAARRRAVKPCALSDAWINLAAAARLAGVSTATIVNWRRLGEIRAQAGARGPFARYARVSIMARARKYWRTCRFVRMSPPEWLQAEISAKAAAR